MTIGVNAILGTAIAVGAIFIQAKVFRKLRRHALQLNTEVAAVLHTRPYLYVWSHSHAGDRRSRNTNPVEKSLSLAKRDAELDLPTVAHYRQTNGAAGWS